MIYKDIRFSVPEGELDKLKRQKGDRTWFEAISSAFDAEENNKEKTPLLPAETLQSINDELNVLVEGIALHKYRSRRKTVTVMKELQKAATAEWLINTNEILKRKLELAREQTHFMMFDPKIENTPENDIDIDIDDKIAKLHKITSIITEMEKAANTPEGDTKVLRTTPVRIDEVLQRLEQEGIPDAENFLPELIQDDMLFVPRTGYIQVKGLSFEPRRSFIKSVDI